MSTSDARTILVTGATGKQGGAVMRELLAAQASGDKSFSLHALTRNPSSDAAQALAKQGITVVKGDMGDRTSLDKALAGVHSALLLTDAYGKGGVEQEVKDGINFVDAAKAAGVSYIVFNSVGSVDIGQAVPHFNSKHVILQHLEKNFSSDSWADIRPVAYFDNLPLKQGGMALYGALGAFKAGLGDKKLKFVSVRDIGVVSAKALLNQSEWAGKHFELFGDEKTIDEVQEAIGRAQGKGKVWRAPFPRFLLGPALGNEMSLMFKWFRDVGYRGNLDDVRKVHPGVQDAEAWARDQLSS